MTIVASLAHQCNFTFSLVALVSSIGRTRIALMAITFCMKFTLTSKMLRRATPNFILTDKGSLSRLRGWPNGERSRGRGTHFIEKESLISGWSLLLPHESMGERSEI
ncbi:hypothetical protein BU25DRAFT_101878 [Macroventuria anomochaeta]|uniref:Uncharacterized protein n=1 Tax=Macroventuria anomochaeta TaxID=301207 RepID=A0ACB6RYV1_9PLEO|nr:uncharacterized protein BU25DRAFT_101878 [Macroventuria anomochaeta]KAF2626124.1 hypothetical protein BU25DRAFT_101878 [Macroventuria anomochaeta]